ncbi:MFS transporter [Tumebacillus sp. ITR2]|uniref:MFS transporter n=1 Tax=Tumebacillus amylolyticus TaxID=2801339 RepID=A0ABS1JAS5_9BACL|nr:MFS transporter [Tumebacillus amylolyticus]MBL0387384.1 MFS transporter [Tumebacillus amylolyticus]
MSYRELLRHRGYSLLFSGQVLSQVGDAVYEVGIVWLVYRLTGSAAALGWLAFCQSVPYLVCGLLAGALADRWNRRTTMLVSDLVRAAAVAYLAVRYATGNLTAVEVCAVAVVLTTARSFFHPAMRALYPEMLGQEQLLLANSLSEGSKRICKVGGMMLGGVLMAQAQADVVLWGNAASFLLSFVTLLALKKTAQQTESVKPGNSRGTGSLFQEIRSAFGEVYRRRQVLFAIAMSSFGLVVSAGLIKVGLPLLAGNVLHGEGDVYGLLMACFSIGMFLSTASMKKLAARLSLVQLVAVGWLLYGAMFVALSFAPPLTLACVLVGATGFAHFLTDIPVTTLIQQTMPLHRMSACQSIWATASFGSESLGVILGGAVLGVATVGLTFAAAGALLLSLGVVSVRKLRGFGQNVLDRQSLSE